MAHVRGKEMKQSAALGKEAPTSEVVSERCAGERGRVTSIPGRIGVRLYQAFPYGVGVAGT